MADVTAYDPVFEAAGNEWNVDPQLLKAMAIQESGGRTNAVSSAGAQGLMQIIPSTQKYLGVTDPNDPVQSIYGAAKYMNEALDKEGSPEKALLYYHGGPGWRQAYGPESAGYVPAVTAHYKALASGPDQTQQTQPQPAAAAPSGPQGGGPLIIGDSLASKQGLGGTGVVGAQPKAVLDGINGLPDDQVKGRDVILSSGASNNPAQASLVYDQVKTLKDRGANSVTVVGVGDRPDLAGVNDTLAMVTGRAGGRFVPVPTDQLSSDRIHPTPQGYRTLLAAATPKTATDAAPASAQAPAVPTGAGNAMASNDPLSLLPPAPKPSAGGGAAPAVPDDPLSLLPPAPKPAGAAATTQDGTETTVRGAARNVAAGVLQGAGGALNFLSDPAGNLMRIPLTAGAFLYDAGARATGLYNPLTPEQRADLTSDTDMPQPGTRLVEAIAQPSQVPANTQTENLLRAAAAGGMGGLLIPGLIGPVAGASGAVTGNVAAQAVPEWAKPAAELAGNVVGGAAPFAVRPAVNALVQGVQKAAGPPLPPNYSPLAPRVLSPQFEQAPMAPGLQQRLVANPQPGMGAAQPAGAQVSTAAQAAMTPEEAANARTVANKQWLNDPVQPGIRDPNADIPGITLNLAEQEQTVQAARELKSLKTANPELSQEEKLILDKNTRERKAFFDETIGSDITRAGDLKAANTKIETDLANVWKGKNDAEPAATKAQIKTELDSSAGDLPPIQSAMKQISDSLEKAGTDPQAMYRTHRLINYLQSKVGQLANPGYGSDSVQAALTRVKATLKGDINNAAPGFDKAMSDYATARGPIDAAKALQDRENGLYDSRGHMQFLPVHKLVRDIIEAQRWDAPDHPLQFVSDEQMARLKTLHDNLKRVASAQDLAAARGSDTVQNAVDLAKGIAKAGGAVAAHAVANKIAPVAGSFVVNALGQAIERGRAARTQRRQMQRGMEMLNPPPTNALQQGPP